MNTPAAPLSSPQRFVTAKVQSSDTPSSPKGVSTPPLPKKDILDDPISIESQSPPRDDRSPPLS